MQSNSLRATTLLSLSFGTLLVAPITCQATPAKNATVMPGAIANDDVGGLPPFLLKVPGGNVQMGLELDAFLAVCAQAAFEFKPEQAHKVAKDKFVQAMRRSLSLLGRQSVRVEPFYLGKWPVKNSEYQVYVDRLRAAQVDIKPPLDWWKDGCPKDYETHLDKIRQAFPKDQNGALLYWERHGHELPYKVQDQKGNSTGDLPVCYISWRDANRFAASLGMRLPTEAELTRAMRGDGTHSWPTGEQGNDVYSAGLLKKLQMASTRQYVRKPVGTVTAATGPFGHLDMFGQVWQLCGDLGYEPIHGVDALEKIWKKLQKDKIGRLLESKPGWRADLAIAKGGSFLSYQEPVQLLIDARAPMQTVDVFESMGMRLAKSLKPGYDYLYSLQRVQFSRDPFAKDQDLDLSGQVGAERYTLAATGFPSGYEAMSFAPVNWLVPERTTLRELLPATQEKPLIIGALATTAKFQNGSEPGLYAVFYRNMGIPKKLSDAVKRGHKEVLKARKAAEKAKKNGKKADPKADKKKAEKEEKKKKKNPSDWRAVIKRYGLTEDDIADNAAADGNIGWVRIDDVKVTTDRDTFLLGKNGKVVSVLLGTNKKPSTGTPFPAELVIEAGAKAAKANAVAKFRFGVTLQQGKEKKIIEFNLPAVMDQEPPTEAKPWRLPKIE